MSDKEFTFAQVAEHNSKKDLFIVVHDKVYDTSSFVDEHPYVSLPISSMSLPQNIHKANYLNPHSGGEEVMMDVGGQDATEAFEDVGHSDEAREILNGLLVGNLKRQVLLPPSSILIVHLSSRQLPLESLPKPQKAA